MHRKDIPNSIPITFLILSVIITVLNTGFLFKGINNDPKDNIQSINIGDDRQLFIDNLIIRDLSNLILIKHEPIKCEKVLSLNMPWEGETSWCPTVIQDGELYRMWYRAQGTGEPDHGDATHSFTAYAESKDGVKWYRPSLRLYQFNGSGENNICIWDPDMKNTSVFKDYNPDVRDNAVYKALGRGTSEKPARIYGMISPDGIHWSYASNKPLIIASENDAQFDSPLNAFWDSYRKCYCLYVRGWHPEGPGKRIRAIRMATSCDFINWSSWNYIKIEGDSTWNENLYTNSAHPYYNAPLILMFPKRFLPDRKYQGNWPFKGLSDVLFLSSRNGINFSRPFDEAFLRPGLDSLNWHDRAISISPWIVKTGEGEMSFYGVMNYRTPSNHICRFSLREDGFVSVHAAGREGILTTVPVEFNGDKMEINYSTSAAGYIRVEMTDASGNPIPGYSLNESQEIFGDEINRIVIWNGSQDLNLLKGEPVMIRFYMKEADLYSFRFFSSNLIQF